MNKKHWANTWTEISNLGDRQYKASISVAHQVFFDKQDGNKPKKHKITDKRPHHVTIQSARCCIEIHPFYSTYFDVDYKAIKLDKEKWVIQRKNASGNWKNVALRNPTMVVGEADDGITVVINYDTAYGDLTIKYIQKDAQPLKHEITFTNTSEDIKTFRILQKWSGIEATKCNGKGGASHKINKREDASQLIFQNSKNEFIVSESQHSMLFDKSGNKKTKHCLKLPIKVKGGPKGMDTEFVYGDWTLKQNESLVIDPATATLNNPSIDGDVWGVHSPCDYGVHGAGLGSQTTGFLVRGQGHDNVNSAIYRAFIEWDTSAITNYATVTNIDFKYEGDAHGIGWDIMPLTDIQPTTDAGTGYQTVFHSIGQQAGTGLGGSPYNLGAANPWFPEVGANKSFTVGGTAKQDLQRQLSAKWFALGFRVLDEEQHLSAIINSEELGGAPAAPTLEVTYTFDWATGPIFHYSGEVISASKHTSQTQALNTGIGLVNSHSDLCLTDVNEDYIMDAVIWGTTTQLKIDATEQWDSHFTTYISTNDFLTELLITQYYAGGMTTKTIAGIRLYENGVDVAGGDPAIIDYVLTVAATDHFLVQSLADSYYKYQIPIGMHRFVGATSHTLTLSIRNTDAAASMLITDVRLRGFET